MCSALSRSSTTRRPCSCREYVPHLHLQQEQVLHNAASTIRRLSIGEFYEEFEEEGDVSE